MADGELRRRRRWMETIDSNGYGAQRDLHCWFTSKGSRGDSLLVRGALEDDDDLLSVMDGKYDVKRHSSRSTMTQVLVDSQIWCLAVATGR